MGDVEIRGVYLFAALFRPILIQSLCKWAAGRRPDRICTTLHRYWSLYIVDRLDQFHEPVYSQGYDRMKEVGIRKVIGANRLSLSGQYLGESVLMAALSLAVALLLVRLLLPLSTS